MNRQFRLYHAMMRMNTVFLWCVGDVNGWIQLGVAGGMLDTLVGTSIGGYTLIRLIGSGGMGAVYLAEDPAIGQQVAIKVVRADDEFYFDASGGPQHVAERFKQEARAIASLDHLHILPLYRYGEESLPDGRRAYMVMQYRPEGSLWDWLRRRMGFASAESLARVQSMPEGLNQSWPMGVEEVNDYLRQAASALQYAHDCGIIHRDVKPANFLLRFDSDRTRSAGKTVSLLLSDFGLAKLFSSTSATSHVFGTPLYMAPEQFEGAAVPESDQYALAVTIYLLLAGRPPFDGDPAQLMHKHLNVLPPPIRTYAPTLSEGVEKVIARALAKQSGQRYASIAEFAQAFAQRIHETGHTLAPPLILPNAYSAPSPSQAGPAAPSQKYPARVPSTLQGAAFSGGAQLDVTQIAGGASNYQVQSTSAPSPWDATQVWNPASPAVPQTPATPPQKRVSRRRVLAWSAAGLTVLGIGAGTGIYLYVNSGSTRPSTPTPTPGSTTTAVTTGVVSQALYRLRGHTQAVTGISWSPDGTQLASSSNDHTVRLWSSSSRAQTFSYAGHRQPVLSVAWSPSGALLASGGRDKLVEVWNPSGTLQHRFAGPLGAVTAIVWSTESQLYAATVGDGLYSLPLTTGKTAKRLLKSSLRSLALSPDKRYLAIGTEKGAVLILNLTKAQAPASHANHILPVLSLAWSPNGQLLASGSTDKSAKIMNVATGRVLRTLRHDGVVNALAWDPADSGSLATACADNNVRIWPASGAAPKVYQGHRASVDAIAWSSAGLASGSLDTTVIVWNLNA